MPSSICTETTPRISGRLRLQFPMVLARTKRVIAMFGSIYSCEHPFSKMKSYENKLRFQLIDDHLNNILLLKSSLEPDIVSVSKNMQHYVSIDRTIF